MLEKDSGMKAKIVALLEEHAVMAVATLRDDGWPQATMVGYAHDDLTLYFVVAQTSQKLANIQRDGRISIAIGHDEPTRLRGLSMAARAEVVTSPVALERFNELMRERYHGRAVFSPRETASAVVRASPMVISVIDLGRGPGEPALVSVADPGAHESVTNRSAAGELREVLVHRVRSYEGGHRPGAPP